MCTVYRVHRVQRESIYQSSGARSCCRSEEQIRLPLIVDNTAEILNKRHVCRLTRLACQFHTSFFWRTAAFFVITAYTRTHKVLPRITTASGLRHNMIDRQRRPTRTAVLTAAIIAPDNITPREFDSLIGQINICYQADDAGVGQRGRDSMDPALFAFSDKLGLCKKEENESAFNIANANRLIALVEHEHTPTERISSWAVGVIRRLRWASSRRQTGFEWDTECCVSDEDCKICAV